MRASEVTLLEAATAVDTILKQGYRFIAEVVPVPALLKPTTFVTINAYGHPHVHSSGMTVAEGLYNLGQELLHGSLDLPPLRPAPDMKFSRDRVDDWLRLGGAGLQIEYRAGRYLVTLVMDGTNPFYRHPWWDNVFTDVSLERALAKVTFPKR